MDDSFSRRRGYEPTSAPPITVREDAPAFLRYQLNSIMSNVGLSANDARDIVCQVLLQVPDQDNWSSGNVWNEVNGHLNTCDWFRIYDIIEAVHAHLLRSGARFGSSGRQNPATDFEQQINALFSKLGIGWCLAEGQVRTRGDEPFERSVDAAVHTLTAEAKATSRSELVEAIRDLSRRPAPDCSGAVQHSMAALECLAREIAGDRRLTLGDILKRRGAELAIPKPLDTAVEKVWGYASERGRHIKEGLSPNREEAELVVGMCSAVIVFLAVGRSPQSPPSTRYPPRTRSHSERRRRWGGRNANASRFGPQPGPQGGTARRGAGRGWARAPAGPRCGTRAEPGTSRSRGSSPSWRPRRRRKRSSRLVQVVADDASGIATAQDR